MFVQKILSSNLLRTGFRYVSQSARRFEAKASEGASKISGQATDASNSILGPNTYRPSNFDKWLLTWIKRYPKGQVPDVITERIIVQARSKGRVKAANYMMVVTIIGCITAVWIGKKAAKEGDTVQKRNEEWHRKVNEEHQATVQTQSK